MWEAVEAKTGEIRVAETKGRRGKERSGEEIGRTGKKETKGKNNGGNKKSSRGMGNLGRGGRSSKVRGRSKEVGTEKVLLMDKGLWKETV